MLMEDRDDLDEDQLKQRDEAMEPMNEEAPVVSEGGGEWARGEEEDAVVMELSDELDLPPSSPDLPPPPPPPPAVAVAAAAAALIEGAQGHSIEEVAVGSEDDAEAFLSFALDAMVMSLEVRRAGNPSLYPSLYPL